MVEIAILYRGELRCEAVHGPSGVTLTTDAPKDNQGKGESFSPTDLVATALGSCMLTIMGMAARKLGVDITGATVSVTKGMVQVPLRRIGSLTTVIAVPGLLNEEQKDALQQAAFTCPVHQSLHPDIAIPVEFRWEG